MPTVNAKGEPSIVIQRKGYVLGAPARGREEKERTHQGRYSKGKNNVSKLQNWVLYFKSGPGSEQVERYAQATLILCHWSCFSLSSWETDVVLS